MSSSIPLPPEPGTVEAVDFVLEKIGRSGAAGVELELLSDLNKQGASHLKEVWLRIPTSERSSLVRRMVEDAEAHVERSYGRALRIAITDPESETRKTALDGLWEYDAAGLLDELLRMARSETDDAVRAAVAMALAPYSQRAQDDALDDDDAARLRETLLDLYRNDPSLEVKRRALESAGYLAGDSEIQDAIRESLDSGIHLLQVSALRAMGHQGDERWLPECFAELESDEPELRYEAVSALGMIMDERSASRVVDMLADEDIEVKMAAISALGSIGGQIAMNALRRLIQDEEDELIVEAAEEALEEARLMENPLLPPL